MGSGAPGEPGTGAEIETSPEAETLRGPRSADPDTGTETPEQGLASASGPVTPQSSARTTPARPFQPGASIQAGRYELIRLIGRGGTGWVFEAQDRERSMRVALKTLQQPRPGDEFRLKREFRALADFHHPNLVRMYELGRDGDTSFFTMELVDGVDFVTYVSGGSEGQPDIALLRSALRQLVLAVQALHDDGKLHRDLKPSNVLVDRAGRVVVLDFGLIHETRSHLLAPDGGRIGTLGFMAPEQARGHAAIEASDWYSVGGILFQALTSELPAPNAAARGLDAEAVSRLGRAPSDLAALTLALLNPSPHERPGYEAIVYRLGLEQSVPSTQRLQRIDGLIGRSHERERLSECLEQVRMGRPARVVITGPSGIGKTALADAFLYDAVRNGAIALAGKCHDRDTVPYKALDTIVDELSRYLRLSERDLVELPAGLPALIRVFPALGRVPALHAAASRSDVSGLDPVQIHRQALQALKELLRSIGERKTLVLFIDDLQWGDLDSARLLARLMAPPDPPRMLLLAAFRTTAADSGPAAESLLQTDVLPGDHSVSEQISLDALTHQESRDLVARLLCTSNISVTLCDRLASESAGNAFFASELALSWLAQGCPTSVESVGLSFGSLLSKRIARLSEAAAELLELTIIASRPLRVEVLRAALSGGQGAFWSSIDVLKLERLAHRQSKATGEVIAPCHDRIREVVDAQLDQPRRILRHRQLANAIEAVTPDEHDVLLEHLVGAGHSGPAGECAARAGDAAARVLAFDRAAEFLRQAVELLPAERIEELGILHKLADVLAAGGRSNDAARAYFELSERARDRAERAGLLRNAAVQALAGGDELNGIATFRKLFQVLEVPWPRAGPPGIFEGAWQFLRLVLLSRRALRQIKVSEHPSASLATETLLAISTAGESLVLYDQWRSWRLSLDFATLALRAPPALRALACGALGSAWLVIEGPRSRALRLLGLGNQLAAHAGDAHASGANQLSLAVAHMLAGGFAQCEALATAAELVTRGLPASRTTNEYATQTRIIACLWQGKLKLANRELEALLTMAREHGHLFLTSGTGPTDNQGGCAGELEVHRSRAQRAADEPVLRYAGIRVTPGQGWRWESWLELLNALYCGDIEHAEELHQRLQRDPRWRLLARVECAYLHGHLALVRATIAPTPALRATVVRALRRVDRIELTRGKAYAGLLRAGLAKMDGDLELAGQQLTIAAERFLASEMLLHSHCARRALGFIAGGTNGLALVSEAEAFMREQSIVDPERWTRCYVPGFARLLELGPPTLAGSPALNAPGQGGETSA